MAYTRPFYNCGAGMVAAMDAQGDTPAGPSVYVNINPATMRPITDGQPLPKGYVTTEECWGGLGFYRADNFQGGWRVRGPFTGAA